jgi:hypothetical protein
VLQNTGFDDADADTTTVSAAPRLKDVAEQEQTSTSKRCIKKSCEDRDNSGPSEDDDTLYKPDVAGDDKVPGEDAMESAHNLLAHTQSRFFCSKAYR